MHRRALELDRPLDLRATLGPLRHGPGDPTIRLAAHHAQRASNSPDGPVALELFVRSGRVEATAWGPGSGWALDNLPSLIGAPDRSELVPHHPVVRELMRRNTGHRMCASLAVMDSLVPTILGQRVTSVEAHRSYRSIVYRYGTGAPGPLELKVPPLPSVLARVPYHELHPLGVERTRATVIREACSRAGRLEEAASMEPRAAERRLQALPGIGAWTSAVVVQAVLGDPDAVIVGDYHLPNIVSWALAREPRADDRRMLELLEPYRGQRARVVRLLKTSGLKPPKFGPKQRIRNLATF